jgi:hypothetical protein
MFGELDIASLYFGLFRKAGLRAFRKGPVRTGIFYMEGTSMPIIGLLKTVASCYVLERPIRGAVADVDGIRRTHSLFCRNMLISFSPFTTV